MRITVWKTKDRVFFFCFFLLLAFCFFVFLWLLGLVAGLFGTCSVRHSAANLGPYLDTNAELARTLGLSLAPAFTASGHRGTGAAESVRLRDEVMAAAWPLGLASPTQSQLPPLTSFNYLKLYSMFVAWSRGGYN